MKGEQASWHLRLLNQQTVVKCELKSARYSGCHFSSCCSSSTVVLLCFSTSLQLPQCNCRRAGAWGGKEITKQVLNSKVNTPLIVNNRWWGSDWLGYAGCPSSQSCFQSRLKTWETTYRMQDAGAQFQKIVYPWIGASSRKDFSIILSTCKYKLHGSMSCLVPQHVSIM